jgi:hypothetical protein
MVSDFERGGEQVVIFVKPARPESESRTMPSWCVPGGGFFAAWLLQEFRSPFPQAVANKSSRLAILGATTLGLYSAGHRNR